MKLTHEILSQAALDSEVAYEYNKDKPPHMRISRAGQPLVSLLLEDFIFPKLPKLPLPTIEKTPAKLNGERVKRTMANATGYVFEQVVIDILKENPDVEVLPQVKLNYSNLSGTCDVLLFNKKTKTATVVECKALKHSTKKSCVEESILNDTLTGYITQLAIYKEAVALQHLDYQVKALWMVWAKGSASLFKIDFDSLKLPDSSVSYALAAVKKTNDYNAFKVAVAQKDFKFCMDLLDLSTLPAKGYNGYDRLSNTCSIQFNPWSDLLIDLEGYAYTDSITALELMVAYALEISPENSGQIEKALLDLYIGTAEEEPKLTYSSSDIKNTKDKSNAIFQ
jgi:hypothetical protein